MTRQLLPLDRFGFEGEGFEADGKERKQVGGIGSVIPARFALCEPSQLTKSSSKSCNSC